MKVHLLLALLMANTIAINTRGSTNNPPAVTNVLAFYFVADGVSDDALRHGTATPFGLRLITDPILSDNDFLAWDTRKHSFVITPAAAIRLVASSFDHDVPFVLMASGEPIYVGMFESRNSSSIKAVPEIATWGILSDCFMGITNVPIDVLRQLGQGDPSAMSALTALKSARTNVTLQIDPPIGFYRIVDNRPDPRIASAVEKLLRNDTH
jgi:hypothetical protein